MRKRPRQPGPANELTFITSISPKLLSARPLSWAIGSKRRTRKRRCQDTLLCFAIKMATHGITSPLSISAQTQPWKLPALPYPDKRDLSDWHNDTFVNGPSWEEFTRAMGIDSDSKAKTSGSVYVVSVYRPAPGHRDGLEKMLSEPPSRPTDTSAGNVLMQHLEGGPWTFLTIARYNSWDDYATNEKNSVAQTNKKEGGWSRFRDHTNFHNDTLTDRIAP